MPTSSSTSSSVTQVCRAPPSPFPSRIRCFRGSHALAPLRLAPCSPRPEGEGGTGWNPPIRCHR
jgi:hypothetical protein